MKIITHKEKVEAGLALTLDELDEILQKFNYLNECIENIILKIENLKSKDRKKDTNMDFTEKKRKFRKYIYEIKSVAEYEYCDGNGDIEISEPVKIEWGDNAGKYQVDVKECSDCAGTGISGKEYVDALKSYQQAIKDLESLEKEIGKEK